MTPRSTGSGHDEPHSYLDLIRIQPVFTSLASGRQQAARWSATPSREERIDPPPPERHTSGMKVAVSIPNPVFAEAESLAKRLKASRSELYSRALQEFVGRHAPDRVTEQMDRIIANVGEESDAFSQRAARRVLKRVEW